MKVCIVGAGAVGGLIGTRIAASDGAQVTVQVSALARGETAQALRKNGWQLKQGGTSIAGPVAAVSSDPRELGPQDLVVVAVKATGMTSVAESIPALVGPGTIVLPAMNGVPWWFTHDVA